MRRNTIIIGGGLLVLVALATVVLIMIATMEFLNFTFPAAAIVGFIGSFPLWNLINKVSGMAIKADKECVDYSAEEFNEDCAHQDKLYRESHD